MAVVLDQGLKDGTPLGRDLATLFSKLFDKRFNRLKHRDIAPVSVGITNL
jgi:hypothetical protein